MTTSDTSRKPARQTAAETVEETKSGIANAATDAVETAKRKGAQRAEFAKSSVADEVGGIGSALRTAADEMRSGSPQERTMGQIAEGFADASDAIRGKDLGELVEQATSFARRNPMVFLGGAALLGFAATRFAKASDRNTPAPQQSTARGTSTNPDYQYPSHQGLDRGMS